MCIRDRCSGRYNVFVVNDLMGQASAVENARRQALAAANDLIRVYGLLDIKLNRSLLDNIMLLGLHQMCIRDRSTSQSRCRKTALTASALRRTALIRSN